MLETAHPTPWFTRVAAGVWLSAALLAVVAAVLNAAAAASAATDELLAPLVVPIALVAIAVAEILAAVFTPIGVLVWRNSRVGHVLGLVVCATLAVWAAMGALGGSVAAPAALIALGAVVVWMTGSIVGLRTFPPGR